MNDVRRRPNLLQDATRRLCWFYAALLWLGGLTFYSAVVVPVGAEVTDSTTQGFVTRRVVWWLYACGGIYLLTSSDDLRRGAAVYGRRLWIVLAVCLALLVALHLSLEPLLDPLDQSVRDSTAFYARHRLYLLVTTVQWLVGVFHVSWRLIRPDEPSSER